MSTITTITGEYLAKNKIQFIQDLERQGDALATPLILLVGDLIDQEMRRKNGDQYKAFYNQLRKWSEFAQIYYRKLNFNKEKEELSPVDLATYAELEPWVHQIRQRFFNSIQPPFSSEVWFKEFVESPDLRRTVREILSLSTDKLIDLLSHIDLRDFHSEPTDTAKLFGLCFVAYVLSGIRIPLPKFSVKLKLQGIKSVTASSFGDRLDHPDSLSTKPVITAQIWAPLSDADMKRLRRDINRQFGSDRTKVLSNKNLALLYTVKNIKGNPPQKGNSKRGAIAKYWEAVMNEVNQHCKEGYRDWRSVKRAYVRLKKSFELK